MNGVVASPAQLRSDLGALAFADQLMTFFGTMSGVETWASTIVQSNLTELGFDTERDERLADYLDAIKSSSLSPRRRKTNPLNVNSVDRPLSRQAPARRRGDHPRLAVLPDRSSSLSASPSRPATISSRGEGGT